MVAGNLKVSFRKNGMDIALALPTSIAGKSFYVSDIAGASRVVVPLPMTEGIFWVELMYIPNG
jgi:chemotaxis protein CheX